MIAWSCCGWDTLPPITTREHWMTMLTRRPGEPEAALPLCSTAVGAIEANKRRYPSNVTHTPFQIRLERMT